MIFMCIILHYNKLFIVQLKLKAMTLILQDFIDWINNDECENVIITSYKDNLERPLILLELSVLFAVDDLTKYITHILEEYLSPEDVLNIWLLAQELGLSVLQDLCLAFCLDRFTELPLCWINKLSRQNFLKLVGNINLRIANVNNAESYLLDIVQGWMKVNQVSIIYICDNNLKVRTA